MNIEDIFSWLPEKALSLSEIEMIAEDAENGIFHEGYTVEYRLPEDADRNFTDTARELMSEGKQICCLRREKQLVALIGFLPSEQSVKMHR